MATKFLLLKDWNCLSLLICFSYQITRQIVISLIKGNALHDCVLRCTYIVVYIVFRRSCLPLLSKLLNIYESYNEKQWQKFIHEVSICTLLKLLINMVYLTIQIVIRYFFDDNRYT